MKQPGQDNVGLLSKVFGGYGRFCAQHPWQVIFLVLTSTACIISQGMHLNPPKQHIQQPQQAALDIVLMTAVRAVAVLYSYHRLRSLQRSHSRFVLSLAGLFIVFASFVFTCSVVNVMHSDLSDLKDALFFFLLLIDVVKACTLAHWSLSCSVRNAAEVTSCISHGMAVLGPAITLDTLVETLVIGVGTLSGVKRLEVLCGYGCMSAVVNYLVFMTFYPACLALVLELSNKKEESSDDEVDVAVPVIQVKLLKQMMALEQPNPVIQRVKLIMAAGLMVVHAQSAFLQVKLGGENMDGSIEAASVVESIPEDSVLRWLSDQRADQLVLLILILTLTLKFTLFDGRSEPPKSTEKDSQMELQESKIYRTRCISLTVNDDDEEEEDDSPKPPRSLEESLEALKSGGIITDPEVLSLIHAKKVETRSLEKILGDAERGVRIRRQILASAGGDRLGSAIHQLPYRSFDYSRVVGVCCENVIGYVPLPVGFAGPILVDGRNLFVPMATTEGCLVASTNRGCSALALGGGVRTQLVADGMSRGPVVRLPDIRKAAEVMQWLEEIDNIGKLKDSFNSTSRFARLQKIRVQPAGRLLFIRFVAKTGDAMGMNMVSKGTEAAMKIIQNQFPELELVSLSGNFCTDKKSAAVNWLDGRGKSVIAEAVIPSKVIRDKLKTSASSLVELNVTKNLIGSSLAGSIGGFNAHAANVVAAIFIATGQDPAQVVTSSNCMTLMEKCGQDGEDLYISVTMPSLEVGTVGGGTGLPAQSACLDMLGLRGANMEEPGENACQLARVICSAVLAGELSLMSSLAAGTLVQSHMMHNRAATSPSSLCSSSSSS